MTRWFWLTSIGVGVAITGLLGCGSSRSSRGRAFAVVVINVEDTSSRLGWWSRDVGGGRRGGSGRDSCG